MRDIFYNSCPSDYFKEYCWKEIYSFFSFNHTVDSNQNNQ